MSVNSTGIQALNFYGFRDTREESLMLNAQQEQAFLKRLLNGRDDELYRKLYGQKHARDVYTQPAPGEDQLARNAVLELASLVSKNNARERPP